MSTGEVRRWGPGSPRVPVVHVAAVCAILGRVGQLSRRSVQCTTVCWSVRQPISAVFTLQVWKSPLGTGFCKKSAGGRQILYFTRVADNSKGYRLFGSYVNFCQPSLIENQQALYTKKCSVLFSPHAQIACRCSHTVALRQHHLPDSHEHFLQMWNKII